MGRRADMPSPPRQVRDNGKGLCSWWRTATTCFRRRGKCATTAKGCAC